MNPNGILMTKREADRITEEVYADIRLSTERIKAVSRKEYERLERKYPGIHRLKVWPSKARGRPRISPELTADRWPDVKELTKIYARLLRSINWEYRQLKKASGNIEKSLRRLHRSLASKQDEFARKQNWNILKKELKENRRFSPKKVAAEMLALLVRGKNTEKRSRHLQALLKNRKKPS